MATQANGKMNNAVRVAIETELLERAEADEECDHSGHERGNEVDSDKCRLVTAHPLPGTGQAGHRFGVRDAPRLGSLTTLDAGVSTWLN